ncbi:MAG: hypothetical protein J5843_03780, partial [Clostridia bacterium]|nr:hypothetical protein [Clostridia bacterium]
MSESEAANLFEKPADAKMGDLALPCFRLAKSFRMPPPAIA